MAFLPISKQDMKDRGWEQADFVLVTGDAYVDHHSFGTAIISRVLESCGYRVAILAQPDYKSCFDIGKNAITSPFCDCTIVTQNTPVKPHDSKIIACSAGQKSKMCKINRQKSQKATLRY